MTLTSPAKKEFVQKIFSEITPQYDRLNRLMSLGLDQRWRKYVAGKLKNARQVVDLCAGTGDMSLALLKEEEFKGKIMLVDFSPEMLQSACRKITQAGFLDRVEFLIVEVEDLPFGDNSFDGAMQGFGLRNLGNLDKFFSETKRILKKGASAHLLEIAHPENKAFRKIFYFYFYKFLPRLNSLISGNGAAYQWLPQSLKEFPNQKEMAEKMRQAGFGRVRYENLAFGMVACYHQIK